MTSDVPCVETISAKVKKPGRLLSQWQTIKEPLLKSRHPNVSSGLGTNMYLI